MWTDDAAHKLGFGRDPKNGEYLVPGIVSSYDQVEENARRYPARMAKDFNELSEWWGVGQSGNCVMNRTAERLLIYAPPKEPWTTIADTWGNVLLYPSAAGEGLEDRTWHEILNALMNGVLGK